MSKWQKSKAYDQPTDTPSSQRFVTAHLTAHTEYHEQRIKDYKHIVQSLLFSPTPPYSSIRPSTIYDTSHLFVFGDMNFRLRKSEVHDEAWIRSALDANEDWKKLSELDELSREMQNGRVFQGLREADFSSFKPTYKYQIGSTTAYRSVHYRFDIPYFPLSDRPGTRSNDSSKRLPAWTDRILFATHTDTPTIPEQSSIKCLTYTSVPSYIASDHKPITAVLLVPPSSVSGRLAPPPKYYAPLTFPNAPRYFGKALGWFVGWVWCLFKLVGMGRGAGVGLGNFVLGLGAMFWWQKNGTRS